MTSRTPFLKKAVQSLLTIVVITLILMAGAFYNKFPRVSSDTGTYIASGIEYWVPYDRPVVYGLFIRYFSFFQTLWSVIFFQCFILAYVLFRVIRIILDKFSFYITIAIISITAFFSGVIWYSGELMPDIFTPIAALCLLIILVGPNTFMETVLLI